MGHILELMLSMTIISVIIAVFIIWIALPDIDQIVLLFGTVIEAIIETLEGIR